MNANGTPVTRAELAAHIKGIDEHFDHFEAVVSEIRVDVHELHTEVQTGFRLMQSQQWLGPQGRTFLTSGALLTSLVALVVAVWMH